MKVDIRVSVYQDSYWEHTDWKTKEKSMKRKINKCSACTCSYRTGDVVIKFMGRDFHRRCLHDVVQQTYDEVPAAPHETFDFSTDGALERYRQHLLEKWAKEDDDPDHENMPALREDGCLGSEVENTAP